MTPRILVLMAAYNGERYLREQIDSVLAQEGDFALTLRIRDDGSSDGTAAILEEYRSRFPDRVEVLTGENIGYNACFFTLIDSADDCDYCALSDQDDVWLPGKLQAAIRALEQESGPALYASASQMTDAELHPTGLTRLQKKPLAPANTLIQNICPGHNQVMNRALLELVQQPRDISQIYVYDLWIANLAALYGVIRFDPEPRTLYRQHGNNELGSKGSALGKLVKAGKRSLAGEGKKNQRQMAYFAEQNREALERAGLYGAVQELLGADTFGKRLRFAAHCPFYRQSGAETLAFKAAVLFGKY
ncbi:MAG: glycosyltransferase family 2 protein [Lachnospiraceae bacterium]|nr:glycosyltransferase family 2 protein [Lachnospiraceae bacterium]